jgi:hypothetical protein
MIEISLYVLLIAYGLVVAAFIVFAIFNLYHLFSFGFLSFLSFGMTFIFLAGAILILFITYKFAVQIDWSQTLII